MIGTDYGHVDIGHDLEAHRMLLARQDVPIEHLERIVDSNARAAFGLG